MIRARFLTDADDCRPVKFPPPHPWWKTGEIGTEERGRNYSVIVAYADSEEQIKEYWPEATHIESQEVDSYTFTDRFPKPSWFKEKS